MREEHVRPAEVVVLHVEVTLDSSALVVEVDDFKFALVEVVRDDGAVDAFLCSERPSCRGCFLSISATRFWKVR